MEGENNGQNRPQKKNGIFRGVIVFVVALLAIVLVFWAFSSSSTGEQVGYQVFESELSAGHIDEVDFANSKISYKTKDGKWYWFYNRSSFEDGARELVSYYNEQVRLGNIDSTSVRVVTGSSSTVNFFNILYPILWFVVLGILVFMVIRSIRNVNSRGTEFTKNRARVAASKVKFDRVAGADEEKAELEEIIQFLKDPEKFTKIGARIPKGVLLVGPPGTGKTLLAKAVAGEANVPFFTISGSDFMELYVGVGASRVRDLFENAKRAKPCIVFIDEIDAVGRQRGTGLGGGNDEREQTLNQLLVQMDGFEQNEGIIVMAATNRADILDPALTRPGRFDRQIYISSPDVRGREEILRVHAEGKPLAKDVKLKEIARVTSGFTGADLENLLNEAAILAARRNRVTIGMEDINNAITKVTMGPQKRSRVVSEKDKRITAYHESGHAIVERCVKNANPVHEVSIIQRGGAAGYTISRPENDESHMTKQKLLDTITVYLGGRASEEVFLDDITAGASSDISQATKIARHMVTEFGMSSALGLVSHSESSEPFIGRDYQTRATYSEVEAAKIDEEVKAIIDKCFADAKAILSKHKKQIETMVDVLLEKETIYSDEVDMIMKGSTKEEVVEFIESRLKAKKAEDDKQKEEEERARKLAEEMKQNASAGNYVEALIKEAEQRAKEREAANQPKTTGTNADVQHETTLEAEKKAETEVKKETKVERSDETKAERSDETKAEHSDNTKSEKSGEAKSEGEKKTTRKPRATSSKPKTEGTQKAKTTKKTTTKSNDNKGNK